MPWELERCPCCGASHGLPNIRQASREATHLEQRFRAALNDCDVRNSGQVARDFMQHILDESRAVINDNALFFRQFFNGNRPLYNTYAMQTEAQVRTAADFANDSQRRMVEAEVFGTLGSRIRYAALSLDGIGLRSYGSCSMVLRQQLCSNLATLTEENTFELVKHHQGTPSGYRA
ncbi:MAG: hypothetical protein RL748_2168, partial [Pseudomonadota bacterium]